MPDCTNWPTAAGSKLWNKPGKAGIYGIFIIAIEHRPQKPDLKSDDWRPVFIWINIVIYQFGFAILQCYYVLSMRVYKQYFGTLSDFPASNIQKGKDGYVCIQINIYIRWLYMYTILNLIIMKRFIRYSIGGLFGCKRICKMTPPGSRLNMR